LLPGAEPARPLWPVVNLGVDAGLGIDHADHVTVFQGAVLQAVPLPPVARSAYLETVRRIAPPDPPGLIGREAELAELSDWCLAADSAPYVWWQAEKYAGKSALMATFVLRQSPAMCEQARVVSFFITARLAAQDTRDAFIQTVLEELADLLGQSLPPVLPEAIREAYLLDLMAQAAATCQEAGRRLVLVVDGLDEDRGVTVGKDAHSIAALLPTDPPHGMRVIVAGRPNPPVPDDVPAWHPLRGTGVIRLLAPSPHARDIMRLAQEELKGLLRGGSTGLDLLGLLTAARGGLSGPDLEDLTGVPLWTIEDILHTVDGRTFSRRPGRWLPDASAEVYLLGHEDLQEAATRYLAKHGLEGYRDRLHVWVDGYRARGWPRDTPEYPLRGYFRLLDYVGDLPRLVECARDPIRHDRMLDLSGGDEAALREVRTALDRIVGQDVPELGSALALAFHRDYLVKRNDNIPAELPAVWARLGQTVRAQALARSITDPETRCVGLMAMATALVEAGRPRQAWEAFEEAAEIARTNSVTSYQLSRAQVDFANALSWNGHYGHAWQAATALTGSEKNSAVSALAEALARAEDLGRAEEAALAITDAQARALTFAKIAATAANDGEQDRASALAGQARVAAEAVTEKAHRSSYSSAQEETLAEAAAILDDAGAQEQAAEVARGLAAGHVSRSLSGAARALANAGAHTQAIVFAHEAMREARLASQRDAISLRGLAARYAASGEQELAARTYARAQAAAASPWGLDGVSAAWTLGTVAGVLAREGLHEQAAATAQEALDVISTLAERRRMEPLPLPQIVQTLAAAGRFAEAEALARSLPDDDALPSSGGALYNTTQYRALTGLAEALARAGRREQAEAIVGVISGPQDWILGRVAVALAQAGCHEQAVESARSVARRARMHVLAEVAEVLMASGHCPVAVTAAREALGLAGEAPDPTSGVTTQSARLDESMSRHQSLIRIVRVFAAAGDVTEARAAAKAITEPSGQAEALASAAVTCAKTGRDSDAAELAWSIAEKRRQADGLADVAEALAKAGHPEPGVRIAESIPVAAKSAQALTAIARSLADTGQDRAASIAQRAEAAARSAADTALDTRATSRVFEAAHALARDGLPELAEAMARWMTDPSARDLTMRVAARGYAALGRREQAAAVIGAITDEATQLATRQDVAAELAGAMARAGRFEDADALVRSIINPRRRATAMMLVAESTAKTGAGERAAAMARIITDPQTQVTALVNIALALCGISQEELAESIAHSITDPLARMYTLAQVALAMAKAGKAAAAGALARQSAAAAQSLTDPQERDILESIVDFLAEAGLSEQASAVAQHAAKLTLSMAFPATTAEQLTPEADGPGEGTEPLTAEDLAKILQEAAVMNAKAGKSEQAVALAQSITAPKVPEWRQESADQGLREDALAAVAKALAETGQHQQADTVARSIADPGRQARALNMIASVTALAHARAGQYERAESVARAIAGPQWQDESLTEIAAALAEAGEAGRAMEVARAIAGPQWQAKALARVAVILAKGADAGIARRAAGLACAVGTWTTALHPLLLLEPSALDPVAGRLGQQPS
jgi:hypothetical protein